VTFTATVSSQSGTPTGGTVAFYANGSATPIACSGGNQALSGGQATCTTTLTAGSESQCTAGTLPAWPTACQGTNSIEAVYSGSGSYQTSNYTLTELVEAHATGTAAMSGPSQFCNTGPIVSPDETAGMLYPSVIGVSGYANGTTVGNVTVELEGATATTQNAGLNDQFLLVAPGGGAYNLDFLDEAFVGNGISDVSLTVADGGTNPFDMTPTTGDTYEPYDHNVDNPNDIWATSSAPTYDANIPQVPGTINRPQTVGGANAYTLEQAFSGAPANGDWALYVYGVEAVNTLSGGWCINLTPNTGNPTATTVTSTYPKATTGQSVTITATVGSSDGTPTGTVTFVDSTLGTTLAEQHAPQWRSGDLYHHCVCRRGPQDHGNVHADGRLQRQLRVRLAARRRRHGGDCGRQHRVELLQYGGGGDSTRNQRGLHAESVEYLRDEFPRHAQFDGSDAGEFLSG
jgi:hypothetical protein